MNTKTMEGLVGASTNIKNMDTPMRVFKDARRRGDVSVMKRAMGYAADYAEEAYDYYDKAEEGMEEDAKAAREKAKALQEKAIQKRKEEQEKLKDRLEKSKEPDTVEVSQEGKDLLEENPDLGACVSGDAKPDNPGDMGTYTKDGRVSLVFPGGENIDIAVTD